MASQYQSVQVPIKTVFDLTNKWLMTNLVHLIDAAILEKDLIKSSPYYNHTTCEDYNDVRVMAIFPSND